MPNKPNKTTAAISNNLSWLLSNTFKKLVAKITEPMLTHQLGKTTTTERILYYTSFITGSNYGIDGGYITLNSK